MSAPERIMAIKMVGAKEPVFFGGDTSGPFDATEYVLAAKEAENERLRAALDQRDEGLQRIAQWADAYPVEIFTPPTEDEKKLCVDAMEAAVRNGSSKMHASWARHVLDGISGIARAALGEQP